MNEPAVVPQVYRRSLTLDNNVRDDGTPKIVILLSVRVAMFKMC